MPLSLSLNRLMPEARARVFAFPHAGGGASAFGKLRLALLKHGIELCALQPPGRENRFDDRPAASVEEMAHAFTEAIVSLPPLPFSLLGHSFGGLVAFVAAGMLEERGVMPDHLFASGSLAPDTWREPPDRLDRDAFRARMIALGGIPDMILQNEELYVLFESGIRDDMRIGSAFRPSRQQPLACPITVYSGSEDRAAPPAAAAGWTRFGRQPLRTRVFEGGHFFLYADPARSAAALAADMLQQELQPARQTEILNA